LFFNFYFLCNLFARVHEVRPLCSRGQPLNTSLLGLCRKNKRCFQVNCLCVSYLSLKPPATFLVVSLSGFVEMLSYHLLCHPGASSWTAGKDPTRCQQTALIEVVSSSQWVGLRALDAQQNPGRHRNLRGEVSTAQVVKNLGLYSGLPQEAEVEIDHLLMRHPCNHFLG
jgi:hypothetical protein